MYNCITALAIIHEIKKSETIDFMEFLHLLRKTSIQYFKATLDLRFDLIKFI